MIVAVLVFHAKTRFGLPPVLIVLAALLVASAELRSQPEIRRMWLEVDFPRAAAEPPLQWLNCVWQLIPRGDDAVDRVDPVEAGYVVHP